MMTLTQYYLIKLAEEASEVAQIALKSAHFGLSERHPERTENNAQRIYAELNDLLAMVYRLEDASRGEFHFVEDRHAVSAKMDKVDHYLAYSQSLGMVESSNSEPA